MDTKVKLEVYVARPPTKKCRQVLAVMEEVVRRYPEQVRLVVFERGAPWREEPSPAVRVHFFKGCLVPVYAVGGQVVAAGQVPTLEDVEARLLPVLEKHSTGE